MSPCGFFKTCRPDLVAIGDCYAFPAGRSASCIWPGASFQVVGDDGLMGTSPHGELKEGSCSCGHIG